MVCVLTGLRFKMIQWAHATGLLTKGTDYLDCGRNLVYNTHRMLALAPDIRISYMSAKYRANRKTAARHHPLIVSTKAKNALAEAIKRSHDLEGTLLQRLFELQETRRGLEEQYHYAYWETPDCPHCKGRGLSRKGLTCQYCGQLMRNGSQSSPAADSPPRLYRAADPDPESLTYLGLPRSDRRLSENSAD